MLVGIFEFEDQANGFKADSREVSVRHEVNSLKNGLVENNMSYMMNLRNVKLACVLFFCLEHSVCCNRRYIIFGT